MPIDNPEALVEAFKESGEFDRFQKELLAEFQKDESYSTFKADIGDIVRQRLAKAQMLNYLPQDIAGRDLTQEVERYPIVDRAVDDMRMFSNPAFLTKIQNALQRILQEDTQKRRSSARLEMEQDDHHGSQGATIPTSKTHDTGLKAPPERLAGPVSTSRSTDDAMDVDND